MRFKQFIAENDGYSLDQIAKEIKRNCKPFLDEANGEPLLRGIKAVSDIRINSQPRNRLPKDSDPGFNFMFNAGVHLAFGIEAVRPKSFYATGAEQQARTFGPLNFIFPIGEFSYMWSITIEDSYEKSSHIYHKILDNLKVRGFSSYYVELLFSYLADQYEDYTVWMNEDDEKTQQTIINVLRQNVAHDNEEGVESLAAVAVNKNFAQKLKAATKQSIKDLYLNNTDFHDALRSKNEIAITESGGYYSIPVATISDHIWKLQGNEKYDVIDDFFGGSASSSRSTININEMYSYLLHLIAK